MSDTPPSLLERCRNPQDQEAWQQFVQLYTPFIHNWLRIAGAQPRDVDDLTQEVFLILTTELPGFQYDRSRGKFRSWVRQILGNRLRHHRRGDRLLVNGDSSLAQRLQQLEDPYSDLGRQWDEEHDRYITEKLLEVVRTEIHPQTWEAFIRVTLHNQVPAQVAANLEMSVGAVYLAKSRVLSKLREVSRGIL